MKYVLLCGGRGERFPGDLPKPLNKVDDKAIGYHMINSLDKSITELIWILNPRLKTFNIERSVYEWNPNLHHTFIYLPYETRDPCESLQLGLSQLNFTEDFICLDNDNIYRDGLDKFDTIQKQETESAILCKMIQGMIPCRYGFIKIEKDDIVEGREKQMGWGENAYSCGGYWFSSKELCLSWIAQQKIEYTEDISERSLLTLIMRYSKSTKPVLTQDWFSIGTPEDCQIAYQNGFFSYLDSKIIETKPMNVLPITRGDAISIKSAQHVIKTGNVSDMRGQAYYYEFLQKQKEDIRKLFPHCYDILYDNNKITIDMEYIKGVPGSYLWSYNTWGEREWKLVTNALNKIHAISVDDNISPSQIRDSYFSKLKARREKYPIFASLDPDNTLYNSLLSNLAEYKVNSLTTIHGDSFLGNIIFPMKGGIKFIDMRGEIDNKLTVIGDPNYDWAKLATSFLAMDSIVYDLPQRDIKDGMIWISKLENSKEIIFLALFLMYSCLPFYSYDISAKIVSRIKEIDNILVNLET